MLAFATARQLQVVQYLCDHLRRVIAEVSQLAGEVETTHPRALLCLKA